MARSTARLLAAWADTASFEARHLGHMQSREQQLVRFWIHLVHLRLPGAAWPTWALMQRPHACVSTSLFFAVAVVVVAGRMIGICSLNKPMHGP